MSQKVMGKAAGVLIICLLWIVQHSVAQKEKSPQVSSSKKISSNNLATARQLVDKEPVKAVDLLSQYFRQNLKYLSKAEESEIYQLLGNAHYNLEQHDLALQNYFKAINLLASGSSAQLKRKVAVTVPVGIYYDVGKAYLAIQNWDSAVHYLDKFVSVYSDDDNEKGEGLIALGEAHLGNGNIGMAENYASEALILSNEINNLSLTYRSNLLKGRILERADKDDEALALYESLLENNTADDDKLNTNKTVTEGISRVLGRTGDFQSQLDFKKKALENSIALQDSTWQNNLNLEIAELYLENEQPGEAIPYLNSGLATSDQIGDIEQSLKASKSLSDVYAAQGDYSQALSNYEKYVDLVGQQYEQKQKEIELSKKVLESLYKNRETISLLEKDRELNASQIALLEKDRDQKNLLIYGLLALILIILSAGYVLYRSISQKRLANQLLTLKSLRSQMNPHFIFNALNSVNSFISKNDTRQANKYLSEFSRLMRIVMENSQSDFVPLSEEVATLELYLKLEHFRFQDKFTYTLEVDPDIMDEEYRIPPMLIQPFIENAIWHGLRYKENEGLLSIRINEEEEHLVMTIQDNGIGRERSNLLKTENQKHQNSTGMKNTENRIQLINSTYGSNIRLAIDDLNSNGETGTRVEVHIPKTLIVEPC